MYQLWDANLHLTAKPEEWLQLLETMCKQVVHVKWIWLLVIYELQNQVEKAEE